MARPEPVGVCERLRVPFTAATALCLAVHPEMNGEASSCTLTTSPDTSAESDHLPAAYRVNNNTLKPLVKDGDEAILDYLSTEWNVDRLNIMHKHLWFAGLARPARPLHYQIVLGRCILPCERADLHLLWRGGQIFVKPLGELVGCEKIWSQYICQDARTYSSAAGFLLSYMWLISTPSDLRIAHQHGLVPGCVDWQQWTRFSRNVLQNVDHAGYRNINARYLYGELRIPQLNYITRWCSLTRGRRTLFGGYFSYYRDYGHFFKEHTTGLAATLVYIAIVLTAMQVGLATSKLGHDQAFQNASYGFTVFSILAPLIVLATIFLVISIGYCFNWKHALQDRRRRRDEVPGIIPEMAKH